MAYDSETLHALLRWQLSFDLLISVLQCMKYVHGCLYESLWTRWGYLYATPPTSIPSS